ncbi:helix-turn-helix domain-containing protein [Aeromicrobium sp.]|uniref:helix-turn-helix domain-containing protein n=1 Tax=Aeromicrobium sp. TaxID=1871063 RepID=UPI0019A349D7|nr:helix-turn-helix domain-containing protein [Aeromicrobium sp.]MBC7630163.1 helix-turn-helix domain-containing protein [Aeromicrobium sp.]
MTTNDTPAPAFRAGDTATIGVATIGSLDERRSGDFLTLSEVADILRVPVNTLRWWRQQGNGPRYFKIGRRLVTTVGDLITWVETQKNCTGPDAA